MAKISTFRIFKYRNFKLFFPGLIISQVGIWVQTVSVSWLVYELKHSPFILGLFFFLISLPLFFLTPFMGVFIDKFDKKKLLFWLQILFAIQAFLITILILVDKTNLVCLTILGIFLNVLVSLDGPLRQSLFPELVDDLSDLANAISINSSCFNLVKLAGPALAGLIISKFDIRLCFLVNFLFILPNIFLVSLLKINSSNYYLKRKSVLKDLKEGLKYIFDSKELKFLQLFLAVFCFFSMTYVVLMPIFTKDIIGSNADILGYLMGLIGLGALISSLLIASKKSIKNLKELMILSPILFGSALILMGLIKNIYLDFLCSFLLGLSLTGFITPQITLLQTKIKKEMRGRVMSFNTICIVGTTSISTLFIGSFTQVFGIVNTFYLIGFILIISSIYFSKKLKDIKY